MKSKFILIACAIVSLWSCQKETPTSMTSEVADLNNLLKSGEYGSIIKPTEIKDNKEKGDEQGEKEETISIDQELLGAVKKGITDYFSTLVDYNCESQVGVFGPSSSCGGYAMLEITMDEEDHQPASSLSGNTFIVPASPYPGSQYYAGGVEVFPGAGSQPIFKNNLDVRLHFCIVPVIGKDGECFTNGKDPYALLQVNDVTLPGSYEVHVFHDNEDHNNANKFLLNGSSIYGGGMGNGHFDHNTFLSFHFFPGTGIANSFPEYGTLGWYRVFGNFNNPTHLFCDDEDNGNINMMSWYDHVNSVWVVNNDYFVGSCFSQTPGGNNPNGNTRYNISDI